MYSLSFSLALAGESESITDWLTPWSTQDVRWIGFQVFVFFVCAFTLWLASKVVVSQWDTGFRRALAVSLLNFFFWQLLLRVIRLAAGDISGLILLFVGTVVCVMITPAKVYGIGLWRALGLSLVNFCFLFLICLVAVPVIIVTTGIGLEAARARWQAVVPIAQVAPTATPAIPAIPADPSPPPAPDLGPEIDGLLAAALHPHGPALPLAEREAIVRQLQDKLRTTRNNLPANDATAVAVYQNRLNRYMLLLNTVKAERQAQTARDTAANRQTKSGSAPPSP